MATHENAAIGMVTGALTALEHGVQGVVHWLGQSVRGAEERFGVGRRANLRARQVGGRIDARTADDVPVELAVAVRYHAPLHYAVLPETSDDAFSQLDDARVRFSASISEAVQTCVPNIEFDDLFDNRERIAQAVKTELEPVLSRFGYEILDVLVVAIRVSDLSGSPDTWTKTGEDMQSAPADLSRWESEGGGN